MPCHRIKDGFVCCNKIVKFRGFTIEFPPIGCPVMLDKELQPIEYEDTPQKFWRAVEAYMEKHCENRTY